jgi:hypothetical protein
MNVGFNTQFSIIWVQQFIYLCEEENGQIIIIQGCVVFNMIVKKIELKHPNLTSQILSECTYLPLKADVFAVSIEIYRFLMFI